MHSLSLLTAAAMSMASAGKKLWCRALFVQGSEFHLSTDLRDLQPPASDRFCDVVARDLLSLIEISNGA